MLVVNHRGRQHFLGQVEEIHREVTRDDRGVAFVLVEHNVEFVLDLSDRVTVLDFGRVLVEGSPDEIRRSPEVQAAYFGAPLEGTDEPPGNPEEEVAP